MFAIFDDRKKVEKQFSETPIPILAVPVMAYVYINGFVSIIQLITDPFLGGQTTFNLTFLVSTTTNIISALVGFFIRFWRREVKYKVQDMLFAGYLFATLSVNILLTFLVKEPGVLVSSLGVLFNTELTMNNYWMLIPAAMIQRVVFAGMVTYYFVKGGAFKKNVLDSLMVIAANRLVPRILLNFARHPDPRVRTEAAHLLDEMYRMHSLKYVPPPKPSKKIGGMKRLMQGLGALITPPKRKQAPFDKVFDALGSEHVQVRAAASKVIDYLFADDPDQALALFESHLDDPDDVKVSCLLESMARVDPGIIARIDAKHLIDRIKQGCTALQATAFGIFKNMWPAIIKEQNLIESTMRLAIDCIDHPSPILQSSCLNFVASLEDTSIIGEHVPLAMFVEKINHPSVKVKESAIKFLDQLLAGGLDTIQLDLIVKLLEDKNPAIQRAALSSLYAVSKRAKVSIPPEMLNALIQSPDKEVQLAAIKIIARLSGQQPGDFDIAPVIALLDSNNANLVNTILQDLGETIERYPDVILQALGKILEKPDIPLKEVAKSYMVKLGKTHFNEVLDRILNIKEDARFAVRNFTREILFDLGQSVPDKLIPVLQTMLIPEKARKNFGNLIPFIDAKVATKVEHTSNETFRVNAASVLGDLAEKFPGKIKIMALFDAAKMEESWRVRRDLVTSLGKMCTTSSDISMTDYFTFFKDTNANVRVAAAKGLLAIAQIKSTSIPIDEIGNLMGDADETVRETLVIVAGKIGTTSSMDVMPLLRRGLDDEKWPVKNAAADAMGKIAESAPEHIPVDALKQVMLEDKDKWARWQAARTLSKVVAVKPGALRLKEIAGKVKTADENMVVALLDLLRVIPPEPMEMFIEVIKPLMSTSTSQMQEQVVLTLNTVHGKTGSELLLSTLLKLVMDKEIDINTLHTSAIALGKIARYAAPELKKRVKKVLGSQCLANRDPVVCNEFTSLE